MDGSIARILIDRKETFPRLSILLEGSWTGDISFKAK